MRRLSLVTLMVTISAITPIRAPAQESSLRAWPEYQVIMWQGGSAAKQPDKFPLYYQRLHEMGVSAGMVYGDGDLKSVLAAKVPYYVENMVNRGLCLKFSSKVTDWDEFVTQWKNDRSEDQCLRDYSLDDPEWQNWARKQVQDLVRKNQVHAPLLYDLRDELSTTISANPFDYDFHPLALNGFRDWLKTQYSSLDALNTEWETSFASWEVVRPMTTDRIKNRMASGDQNPRGKPDWHAVQQLRFDPIEARKTLTAWNFAPWADHRTYMDVSLARELDRLRTTIREMDSATPVGIEGTQMPAAFGGYDLWRLSQVLDWVEPYDICDARAIFGSFMPGKTFLTTVGEQKAADARRRLWHLLLEGDRGCIVWWSEDCIDWDSPDYNLTQRARDLAPVFREMRSPLAALFMQARRDRDPVAIHYSQPSIQAAWLLESTVDGSTWLRRFSSYESAHNRHARVRHGWLKMLEDAGYDPVFVSTQQIEAGELSQHKALVLPQSWAMSDAEATGITKFLNSTDGPRTILADGQAGLFDEHGRLRTTGALDAMIAPTSTAFAVVRRSDKLVPRDHVSFEASPAAYANAEAGGGREQTSGWVDKIRDEWLNYVSPMVIVPADARVKVWKYTLSPTKDLPAGTSPIRLIAFERNMTYRMGEDLQQSADNSAMTGDISITAQLPAPKHAYDLRSGKYLGHSAKLTLNVSSDVPTLIAVSEVLLPEENLVEQLLRQ